MARLALLGVVACGRTEPVDSAAPLDPGGPDAGRPDAGTPDAGNIAAALDGLRWELPCVSPWPSAPEWVCVSTPDVTRTTRLTGDATRQYTVRLRLRGVVETKEYVGATGVPIARGGTPVDDAWNVYRLDVSNPPQRWHLNRGVTGLYFCRVIDEELVVTAQGDATFTLFASTVDPERTQINNHGADGGALLPPGFPPPPFDGQFIQMDVLSVSPAP